MQVLKAVRGGVQDVAAKLIHVANETDMDKFTEVTPQRRDSSAPLQAEWKILLMNGSPALGLLSKAHNQRMCCRIQLWKCAGNRLPAPSFWPIWMSGTLLHTPQEVGILKGLNYDCNIVQFYGACLHPGRDPMLICEYMEGENGAQPAAEQRCPVETSRGALLTCTFAAAPACSRQRLGLLCVDRQ
jgi:hypothetical protein